ncbi:MAG TPA: 50S ribosomal protein L22 [Planctomycetota bacterium]|jgi:large subunit ribosomal protein L22|nr:50S ribosomal protein L22 [Planctomycetota bacterium]
MARFHAAHRFARIGPRKVRLVADLVRGRSANEAIDVLRATHKRAAFLVGKLLHSAISNAVQRPEVRANRLRIAEIWADGGPLRDGRLRWRPGPMGRMMPIRKRTAHIHVVLEDPGEASSAPSPAPAKGASTAPAEAPSGAAAPEKPARKPRNRPVAKSEAKAPRRKKGGR